MKLFLVLRRILLFIVLFQGCKLLEIQQMCIFQPKRGQIGAQSITVGTNDCYYYLNKHESTIYRCCNNTQYQIYSGNKTEKGFQNGDVEQARYDNPTDMVWCGYGETAGLYIADNKCFIRFINMEDQVSTYLGSSDYKCGSYVNDTDAKLTQVSSLACDEGFLVIMNAGSAETYKSYVGVEPQPSSPSPKQIIQSPPTTKGDDWLQQSGVTIWLPILMLLAGCLIGGLTIYTLKDRLFTNQTYRRIENQQLEVLGLSNCNDNDLETGLDPSLEKND